MSVYTAFHQLELLQQFTKKKKYAKHSELLIETLMQLSVFFTKMFATTEIETKDRNQRWIRES